MTDKEIIDEERMFECVWCKYGFKESDANFILSENPNECVCSGCITEWADNLLCDLKRKEQECKKLKSQIEIYSNMLESSSNKILKKEEECEELKAYAQRQENQREEYYKEYLKLSQECEGFKKANDGVLTAISILAKNNIKLRETLTEIKEIAEKYNNAHLGEQQYCCKDILQKISEYGVGNEIKQR